MRTTPSKLFFIIILTMLTFLIAACAPAEEAVSEEVPTSEPTEAAALQPVDEAAESAAPTSEPTEAITLDQDGGSIMEGEQNGSQLEVPTDASEDAPLQPDVESESGAYPSPSNVPNEEVLIEPYPVDEADLNAEAEPYPVDEPTDAATSGLAPTDAPLPPGLWILTEFVENGSVTAPLADTQISAEFVGGGVNGSAGCNTFTGTYTQEASNLTFSELATTRKACEESIAQQETRFIEALQTAVSFNVNNGVLTLIHLTGTLHFSQSPAADTSYPAPAAELDIQPAILDDFRVQVDSANQTATITLIGNYTDGCQTFNSIFQNQEEASTLSFTMLVERPTDAICTQVLAPFEETFPLDISGLDAGSYTIVVNNLSGEFTIE